MELDAFTIKLMERTQARREFLNKKLSEVGASSRKRRTALLEEQQIPLDVGGKDDDGSPSKRQCLDSSSDVEDEDIEHEKDDKENVQTGNNQDMTYAPIHAPGSARGLAALRKAKNSQKDDSGSCNSSSDDCHPEHEESQGFVKSKSQSKLSYEFSKSKKLCDGISSVESMDDENNQIPVSKGDVKLSHGKKLPLGLSTIQEKAALFASKAHSPVKEAYSGPKQKIGQELLSKFDHSTVNKAKDPAELPLSARKALFEKAFSGSFQKPIENTINLSVAQRAAMFEKATIGNNIPLTPKVIRKEQNKCIIDSISPMKAKGLTTPEKILKSNTLPEFNMKGIGSTESPSKLPQSSSSSTELTSPLKNIGPHTRLIHKRLSNCKSKELASKATEDRKNEISALLNHWEKVSSSSSLDSESVSVMSHEQNAISMPESLPGDHRNSSVFNDYEDDGNEGSISFEEMPEESEQENEDNDSLFEEDVIDGISHEKSSSDDEIKFNDITGEAVAVCDEMDEILNNALTQTITEPLSSMIPLAQSTKLGSCSSSSSTSSQYFMADQHTSTPVTSSFTEPITQASESDSEMSLLHTVSFYRKQKQELKLTPVRTIVRREQVVSPPSPEIDKTLSIQERIKTLHNEVLSQQTVISQTSQALNLCHATAEFFGSTEQVEGERLLLIATQKRQIFLNEMQRLKTLGSKGESVEEGTGTLTLDDIRLPLKREFVASQLEGKGNDTVHYFLCLVRFGAQVVFSQMLSTKDDISSGSLNFTNHITLQNLPADFSVAFEVYTLQTKVQVMPHDKKYHIRKEHSKLRLTPKSKKSDTRLLTPVLSSPGGPNAVRTPSFSVVGYTRFTLQNCDRRIYTLEKVPFASPLEGIVQLNIQLHAEHNISEKGFLTMFEDVSGFGAWHRRWCVLDGSDVAFWKYPDDEKNKEPLGIIDLTHSVTGHVRLVSRDICARPHTFQLVTVRPQSKGDKNTLISRSANTVTTTKHLLSADTKEERILWCNKLNEALTNVRKWNPNALCPVEFSKQDK